MDLKQLLNTRQPLHTQLTKLADQSNQQQNDARLFIKGQIVQAKVISVPTPTVAEIQINQHKLLAHTPIKLQINDALQLQVMSTGKLPKLKIIPQESMPTTVTKITTFINQSRITQQPIAQTLTNIAQFANKLPPTQQQKLDQFIGKLLTSVTQPNELSNPGRVKQLMLDSGILLENKILNLSRSNSQFPLSFSGDLKHQLQLVAQRLRQLLPNIKMPEEFQNKSQDVLQQSKPLLIERLLDQTTAALSRIQLLQTHSLRSDNDPLFWHFELPVKSNHQLHQIEVFVEQESKKTDNETHGWRIGLNFEFIETGRFSTRIYLHGDNLTVNFWADQLLTVNSIRDSMKKLHTRLAESGFDVEALHVHKGEAPNFPIRASLSELSLKA